MDKKEVRLDYFIYKNSYPEGYREVCEKAIAAISGSYSPYSGFAVGAAVLLDNDEIFTGTNQENAAYPSGICAERTALFYAGSVRPEIGVKVLAIAAYYRGVLTEKFTPPCGACRQVMAEVIKRYGKDFEVILIGGKETVRLKASALLPFAFELESFPVPS